MVQRYVWELFDSGWYHGTHIEFMKREPSDGEEAAVKAVWILVVLMSHELERGKKCLTENATMDMTETLHYL